MANTSKSTPKKSSNNKNVKSKKGGNHMLAMGLAAGAVVAGLAGAYFMQMGHSSKKKTTHHKSLAYRIKAEVLDGIEKAGHTLTKQNYGEIVDNVMTKYQNVSDFTKSEYATLSKEMKSLWTALHSSYDKIAGTTKGNTKRKAK